jgi:hypothetical protein
LGKERYSLSKKIKKSVKKAVKYISDFENTAAELAIDKNYEYVSADIFTSLRSARYKMKKAEPFT